MPHAASSVAFGSSISPRTGSFPRPLEVCFKDTHRGSFRELSGGPLFYIRPLNHFFKGVAENRSPQSGQPSLVAW